MTPGEVSDRCEIEQVIARYCNAIDHRDWDALDELFTAEAIVDYTAMGGIKGALPEVKAFLTEALGLFSRTVHLAGLPDIHLLGDTAEVVTPCHNPMVLRDGDDPELLVCGLWYHHMFVRTADGWRIQQLREERAFIKVHRPDSRDAGVPGSSTEPRADDT